MPSKPKHLAAGQRPPIHQEHAQLRRLVGLMVISGLPLLIVSIYTSIASGSLSVVALFLHTGVSLLINIGTYFVLGIISRGNVFQFPYGTGKLENFTSLLNGFGVLLLGGTIFYRGILRLTAEPAKVSLGIAQFAFFVGVLRMVGIVLWLTRMTRQSRRPSPLLHAYYVNCKASLWYTFGLLLAMMTGWLLSYRWGNDFSLIADLLIAAYFTGYVTWTGIRVIRANFPSMIDLPLPESDQLKIVQILTRHHNDYSGLGNVLTRRNGNRRRIEIELAFSPETAVAKIEALQVAMRQELQESLGELEFHLIARCPERQAGAGDSDLL